MKKLIQKTAYFLTPVLLVFVFIEVFYRVVPNDLSVKNKLITQNYQNTEILMLGNSHVFYGLNPAFFDSPAFNLANVSQTLYFDKLLFDKHIEKLINLKFVILNIEYTSLSQLKDTQEDVWRKYYYEKYMNLDVPTISLFDPQSYFLTSTRDFSNNLKLLQRYFKDGTLVDCDSLGFGNNYIEENRALNLEEISKVTVKKHEDNLWDFTENVTLIQSIIDICKKRGIKVIIVTMPVSKQYANKVNQTKLKKIFATANLLEKANSNVYYLNLFQDSRFENDDFYDADHLNNEGAKKCSKITNRFVQDTVIN